jgi:hypothetical protein
VSFHDSALLLAWVAIVLLGLAVAGLVRQVHALTTPQSGRPYGPPVGGRAHVPRRLRGLVEGNDATTVLLFAEAGCESCERVVPRFAAFCATEAGAREHALVYDGAAGAAAGPGLRVLEHQAETFDRLAVPATPFAVSLSPDAVVVAAGPVGSPEALDAYLGRGSGLGPGRLVGP